MRPIARILLLLLLSSCMTASQHTLEKTSSSDLPRAISGQDDPTVRRLQDRAYTAANCGYLLNKEHTFTGTVLYETCAKNCLGGCPGSGGSGSALDCYSAIKDANDCIMFLSWNTATYTIVHSPDKAVSIPGTGQEITVHGNITLFRNAYCSGYDCEDYFIISPAAGMFPSVYS